MALPCTLDVPELIQQPIIVAERNLTFTGVSVGILIVSLFSQLDHLGLVKSLDPWTGLEEP